MEDQHILHSPHDLRSIPAPHAVPVKNLVSVMSDPFKHHSARLQFFSHYLAITLCAISLAITQFSVIANIVLHPIPPQKMIPMSVEVMHAAAKETSQVMSQVQGIVLSTSALSSDSTSFDSSLAGSTQSAQSSSEAAPVVTQFVPNQVGVFLTAQSTGDDGMFQATTESLKKVNATALVFDVKGNVVYFEGDTPMARSLGLTRRSFDLPLVVQKARERGIYTIARFVAVSDAGLTSALPETRLMEPKTGRVITENYIDPSNEKALQYNSEVICALAKAGVDEINLDYIRFSTENTFATDVFSPSEKADRVEAFVRMARETINRCGSTTKLGISTFAILGWDYEKNLRTLGQDVVRFAPLVDVISPMAYPSMFSPNAYYTPGVDKGPRNYHLVYRTMTGYQQLLGDQSYKLRPWLQAYGVTTKDVTDQMRGVTDVGVCGFTFWNANNAYSPVFQALKNWNMPEGCVARVM